MGIRRSNHRKSEMIGQHIGRAHEGVKREKLREKGAREEGFEERVP